MGVILSHSELGKAMDGGFYHYSYTFKAITPNGSLGQFVDCGQSVGVPRYNPYAGSSLTASQLFGSGNNGINTGPDIPGKTKYLLRMQTRMGLIGSTGQQVKLLDYLLFYPLIDCDDTDVQIMDNTLTLPRYESGEGVQAIFICTAPMIGSADLTMTYTNSDGVSGRTSTFRLFSATTVGICATSSGVGISGANTTTAFWPLAGNDKGIRSVESVQLSASAGGFLALALVKPIAEQNLFEADVTSEKELGFLAKPLPEIKPGAYLNYLILRGSGSTASISGELIFINI